MESHNSSRNYWLWAATILVGVVLLLGLLVMLGTWTLSPT